MLKAAIVHGNHYPPSAKGIRAGRQVGDTAATGGAVTKEAGPGGLRPRGGCDAGYARPPAGPPKGTRGGPIAVMSISMSAGPGRARASRMPGVNSHGAAMRR